MKFLVDGKEKNLIPYKGNPKVWWDGVDESSLHKFESLVQPVKASTLNSSYSAVRLKLGLVMRGTVESRSQDVNKEN